jgi:tetratricopeptide (TPR) repeat protein
MCDMAEVPPRTFHDRRGTIDATAEPMRLRQALGTSRSRTLLVLVLALAPAFAVTAAITRAFHEHERALADQRFARGRAALARGEAPAAVDDLRTALSLSHVAPITRLTLAQALVAAGRPAEARSHLLTLRDRQPGHAIVNVELARLAAADGDVPSATRYYRDAIEGAWDGDAERRRRETRLALADLLVRSGDMARAQAELTIAAADLPADAPSRVRIAALLSAAGAHEGALDVYASALARAPRDAAALAGAGHEALQLGRYATARSYLARALAADPANTAVRDELAALSALAALDPYARRLRASTRGARARDAFAYAGARLAACRATHTGPSAEVLAPLLDEWHALERAATPKALARQPDLLDEVMALVFRIEERTREACGEPSGVDLALLLMARDRRAAER